MNGTSYIVPARRHVVREGASLARRRQQPRLPEVGELQHAPRADQQVPRLQVAVYQPLRMARGEPLQHHAGEAAGVRLRQRCIAVAEQRGEAVGQEGQHENQVGAVRVQVVQRQHVRVR